jgi:hypothetical protein
VRKLGTDKPWTGARLNGSYQKNATAAQTFSYVFNEAEFNIPTLTPGGYGTGHTLASIWNGLDGRNLLQAEAWLEATATGDILVWNGSTFVPNPTGGCGTSIGVGPDSRGLTSGTPWIAGCDAT